MGLCKNGVDLGLRDAAYNFNAEMCTRVINVAAVALLKGGPAQFKAFETIGLKFLSCCL